MPIMTFGCPKCSTPMSFDYADYSFRDFVKGDDDHFENLECNNCGKQLKTVPWVAVFDEETEEAIEFV